MRRQNGLFETKSLAIPMRRKSRQDDAQLRYFLINSLKFQIGYLLIHQERYKEAIEILKLSVDGCPGSYNTYDSLGEAYINDGDKEHPPAARTAKPKKISKRGIPRSIAGNQ